MPSHTHLLASPFTGQDGLSENYLIIELHTFGSSVSSHQCDKYTYQNHSFVGESDFPLALPVDPNQAWVRLTEYQGTVCLPALHLYCLATA